MSEDPANFSFSQEQLRNIGVLAEDVPELAKSALRFMQTCSDLISDEVTKVTVVSKYAPSNYKRVCYYNRIAGEGECPKLVYRSNYSTPFDESKSRFSKAIVKSIYSTNDMPLGKVWNDVLETICTTVKAAMDNYSSIKVCRFYSHGDALGSCPEVQCTTQKHTPKQWVGYRLCKLPPKQTKSKKGMQSPFWLPELDQFVE
ncbi:hypothetical protein H0H81_002549 [Sphagnurus paluster]|uniref:Uncharacterized protein n=1 Tax=Sphagnurus paluster TaxID=117069 RepID=A0A9P7GLV1_9AGAR|nr:hypothetical protein H0H81_002549 [Sphagnurus paluster]